MTSATPSGTTANQDRHDSTGAETFATCLSAAIEEKGWTLAQAAREISQHLPHGEVFNPVNLSHYMHGRSFPRLKYWDAILRALDLGNLPYPSGYSRTRGETLPGQTARASGIKVQDVGNGTARVEIVQVVPWPDALSLLQMLTQKQN